MRIRLLPHWFGLILAALLPLVGLVPARAQDTGSFVVVEQGQPPAPLLSEDEVAKLQTLIEDSSNGGIIPLSNASPDGQFLVVYDGEQLLLFDTEDGSRLPLATPSLNFLPRTLLGLLFGVPLRFVWADERTLADIALFENPEKLDDNGDPVTEPGIAFYNVVTGDVRIAPLPGEFNDLQAFISAQIAPGARRVLFDRTVQPDTTSDGMLRVPITWPSTAELKQAPVRKLPFGAAPLWNDLPEAQQRALGTALRRLDDRHMLQVNAIQQFLTVYDLDTSVLKDILALPAGTAQLSVGWSPDARYVGVTLFNLDDRESSREVLDGALLTSLALRDVAGILPPAENPYLQNNVFHLIDVATDTTQTLRAADGDGTLYAGFNWSPDGKTILLQSLLPGQPAGRRYPIYTLQFSSGSAWRLVDARNLAEISRLDNPLLASYPFATNASFITDDELIFQVPVKNNIHLYSYSLNSGELRNISDRAGTYELFDVMPAKRQLLFVYSSYISPRALYRSNWDGSAIYRLTWGRYELEQFSQTRMEPVSFTLANGKVREGTLILPKDAPFPPQNMPIIVWQEGGPGGIMNNTWGIQVERPFATLPNFGFGVLVVPLSGRYGLGPSEYNALADGTNFGQVDIDEAAEIVRQMIARGWTSKGKVGITGCSYGGYFTLQSIVRHPDVYAAANDQCSLVDTIIEWTRGYATLMPYLQGTTPYIAPQEFMRDSPSYNVGRITTPLLSFHGSQDFLPVTLNENLHTELVASGRTARFVKFMGEGHGLALPENQLYAAQEQILWFRTYLKP